VRVKGLPKGLGRLTTTQLGGRRQPLVRLSWTRWGTVKGGIDLQGGTKSLTEPAAFSPHRFPGLFRIVNEEKRHVHLSS
jgi:hypothetical protein